MSMNYMVSVSSMSQFGYNPATGLPTGSGVDTWVELGRPLEMKIGRTAGQPGRAKIVIPGVSANKTAPPVHLFQRIMIKDLNPVLPQESGRIFIGRVDSVAPKQSAQYGRTWVIDARDYLASLVDNFVDRGKQRAFGAAGIYQGSDSLDAATTGPKWTPKWVEKTQMEAQMTQLAPDLACVQAGKHCGTVRTVMAMELALNIVPLPFGLAQVTTPEPSPGFVNSLPVEYNFENVANLRILDAINSLAAEDPWSTVNGPYVDSKRAEGIGAMFVIRYSDPDVNWPGQRAQYFRRGSISWSEPVTFVYGESGKDKVPIIGYDFPQAGHDFYSRAKAIGKGESQDLDPNTQQTGGGWGSGFVSTSPQLEGAWDPASGKYAIMRGMSEVDSGLIGEWHLDAAAAPTDNPLEIRGLRDRAAAKITAYAGATRGFFRGLRGTIQVPAYPRRPSDMNGLVLGTVVSVLIPPALGSTPLPVIVEGYEYIYPENVTTIHLSLKPTASIGQVMGGWEKRHDQGGASHSDWWDSGWQLTDGTGNRVFVHAMGVRPRTVEVYAAERDGTKVDQEGKPLPTVGTEVEVPKLAYEAAQGQNFGFFVNRLDAMEVELGLAYWIADSSQVGEWLRDGEALIRVVIRP